MGSDVKSDKNDVDSVLRCQFMIARKNRSCRMQIKQGQKFCAEHACHDPDNQFRIPCPNDPRHTIDKRLLEEHLLKCNKRLPQHKCVVENINKKLVKEEQVFDDLVDEILHVSQIIEDEYAKIKDKVVVDIKKTPIVEEEIKKELVRPKHLKQISSIIGHLLDNKLLDNDGNKGILELGVGRGQLAYYMAKLASETNFVLIDYAGVKHKVDNRLKLESDKSYKIERIISPIEHVDVTLLESLSSLASFSAVCKHFCGSATDFGINLITRAWDQKMQISGFCLVPCCRHRITLDQYTGVGYLKSIALDSDSSFAALRQISSWATCGQPTTATVNMEASDDGPNFKYWSYSKKLALGRKAQVIVEYGRLLYIQEVSGFECQLLEYIESDVSPENLMIVGKKS